MSPVNAVQEVQEERSPQRFTGIEGFRDALASISGDSGSASASVIQPRVPRVPGVQRNFDPNPFGLEKGPEGPGPGRRYTSGVPQGSKGQNSRQGGFQRATYPAEEDEDLDDDDDDDGWGGEGWGIVEVNDELLQQNASGRQASSASTRCVPLSAVLCHESAAGG